MSERKENMMNTQCNRRFKEIYNAEMCRANESSRDAKPQSALPSSVDAVISEFLPCPSAPSGRPRVLQVKVRTNLYEIADATRGAVE